MSFGRRWPVLLIFIGIFFVILLFRDWSQPFSRGFFESSNPYDSNGRFVWSRLRRHHRPAKLRPLPPNPVRPLHKLQHPFKEETQADQALRVERQAKVKDAFTRCWNSYKERTWMRDEMAPISGQGRNTLNGWGITMVDSLDTLYIMGMHDEFKGAVGSVRSINFSNSTDDVLNLYETTTRYLGGFLAAYDLSGDKIILNKAIELGEMLLVAFDTPNFMPITRWRWQHAANGGFQEAEEQVLLAEIGSLSLEFTRLSQITRDPRWYDAISRIITMFDMQQASTKLPGLWPVTINAKEQVADKDTWFTLGGMADTFYEYLPKTYQLLRGVDPVYKKMYTGAMSTVIKTLLFRPMVPHSDDILFTGSGRATSPADIAFDPQGQHLGCATGAMFALGGRIFNNPEHFKIGYKLTQGCIWAYNNMPSGLMPETFHMAPCPSRDHCVWDTKKWEERIVKTHPGGTSLGEIASFIVTHRLPGGFTDIGDGRFMLRAQAIESIFVVYRICGDRTLLDHAWHMFETIMNHTTTQLGNAAIEDVSATGTLRQFDRMESFWMAETLKYFYLLFSDPNTISLDDYVFNAEGHPLKIPK